MPDQFGNYTDEEIFRLRRSQGFVGPRDLEATGEADGGAGDQGASFSAREQRSQYGQFRGKGYSPEVSNILAEQSPANLQTVPDRPGPVSPLERRAAAEGGERPNMQIAGGPDRGSVSPPANPSGFRLQRRSGMEEIAMNNLREDLADRAMDRTERRRNRAGQGMTYQEQERKALDRKAREDLYSGRDHQMGMLDRAQSGMSERVGLEQGGLSERHGQTESRLEEEFNRRMDQVGFQTNPNNPDQAAFVAPSGAATGFQEPVPAQGRPQSPLGKLAADYQAGLISEEEYKAERQRMGGGSTDGTSEIIRLLQGGGGGAAGGRQSEIDTKLKEIRNHVIHREEGDDRFGLGFLKSREKAIKNRVRELRAAGYEFPRVEKLEDAASMPSGTVFLGPDGKVHLVP